MNDLAAFAPGASGEQIDRLATAWSEGRASTRLWYIEALEQWVRTAALSPHTARSYAATVGGFFSWLSAKRGSVPPHAVRSSDVDAWVDFLQAGGRAAPVGLDADEEAAFRAVAAGHDTPEAVALRMPAEGFLARLTSGTPAERARAALGALVEKHALVGDPVRHGTLDAGPSRYRLPPPRGHLSAATISQRLYALQSFFLALVGQGGKQAGSSERGPLEVSPVTPVLKRASRMVRESRQVRSDRRKTRRGDWDDLRRACFERPVSRRRAQRDWTILVCLATMGLRVAELCALRIGAIEPEGDKRYIPIVRKGRVHARVLIPQAAWTEIERLHEAGTGPSFPLACLAVHRWGNQADIPADQPLSTSQVQEIFRELADVIAQETGRSPDEVHRRIHPHGLRHLYAQMLADAGVSIYIVRNLLGHASLATTDTYLTREAGTDTDHSAVFAGLANRTAPPGFSPAAAPAAAAPAETIVATTTTPAEYRNQD